MNINRCGMSPLGMISTFFLLVWLENILGISEWSNMRIKCVRYIDVGISLKSQNYKRNYQITQIHITFCSGCLPRQNMAATASEFDLARSLVHWSQMNKASTLSSLWGWATGVVTGRHDNQINIGTMTAFSPQAVESNWVDISLRLRENNLQSIYVKL